MVGEVDGLGASIVECSLAPKRAIEAWESTTIGSLALAWLTTLLLVEVDKELDLMVDVAARLSELVAIEDGASSHLLLSMLLRHGAGMTPRAARLPRGSATVADRQTRQF